MTKKSINKPKKSSAKASTTSISRSKKRQVKSSSSNGASSHFIQQVCSITDPWCASAKGAKYPGNDQMPSLAYQMRSMLPLSTSAIGLGSMILVPAYSWQYATTTSSTSGYFDYTTLSNFNATGLTPSKVRLVSMGVKLHVPTPALTTQGLIYIRQFAITGGELLAVGGLAYRGTDIRQFALKEVHGSTIVMKPFDQIAHYWHTPGAVQTSANVSDFHNPGWNVIVISVEGAIAGAVVLEVEVVYNWELSFDDNSSSALLVTSAPKSNPLVLQASHSIASLPAYSFFQNSQQLESFVYDQGAKFLRNAASSFIPAFSNLAISI